MAGAALASLGRLRKVLIVSDEPKPARFFACQATVRRALPECEFVITRRGGFDPDKSADVIETMLMKARGTRRPVDAIFTTAETMGAGTIVATDSVAERTGCRRPQIVTYGGLRDGREWIARGKIAHAVVQETEAVAQVVGEQLVSRFYHSGPPKNRAWVPPYLWGSRTRPLASQTNVDLEAVIITDGQLKAAGRILRDTVDKKLRASVDRSLLEWDAKPAPRFGAEAGRQTEHLRNGVIGGGPNGRTGHKW
jgi:hypothetical protein